MDPNPVARQLVHFSRMFKASESNANHFRTLEEFFACCQIPRNVTQCPKIQRVTYFNTRLTFLLQLHLVYEGLHITFLAPYYSRVWKLHNDPTRYHCGTFLCQMHTTSCKNFACGTLKAKVHRTPDVHIPCFKKGCTLARARYRPEHHTCSAQSEAHQEPTRQCTWPPKQISSQRLLGKTQIIRQPHLADQTIRQSV